MSYCPFQAPTIYYLNRNKESQINSISENLVFDYLCLKKKSVQLRCSSLLNLPLRIWTTSGSRLWVSLTGSLSIGIHKKYFTVNQHNFPPLDFNTAVPLDNNTNSARGHWVHTGQCSLGQGVDHPIDSTKALLPWNWCYSGLLTQNWRSYDLGVG